jgi:hypothetical protein
MSGHTGCGMDEISAEGIIKQESILKFIYLLLHYLILNSPFQKWWVFYSEKEAQMK